VSGAKFNEKDFRVSIANAVGASEVDVVIETVSSGGNQRQVTVRFATKAAANAALRMSQSERDKLGITGMFAPADVPSSPAPPSAGAAPDGGDGADIGLIIGLCAAGAVVVALGGFAASRAVKKSRRGRVNFDEFFASTAVDANGVPMLNQPLLTEAALSPVKPLDESFYTGGI
jgi:hypothetical protein